MAIHDEPQSQVNHLNDQAGQQNGNQQNTGRTQKRNFFRGGMQFSPLGNGQYSEIYKKTKEKLEEIFKSSSQDEFKLSVLGIDRVENQILAYSVILVCGKLTNVANSPVAYHVLLLEGSGDQPKPLYLNVDGEQVEIVRTSSDAVDNELLKVVRQYINSQLGIKTPLATDVTVIGRNFNPENGQHMYRVARNAALAVGTALEMSRPDFKDINLADVDLDASLNLNISIQFHNSQNEDDVGNPVRSDVMIGFNVMNSNTRNQSLNSAVNDMISEVDGFIDVLWAPPRNPYESNPYAMASMGMNPMFRPTQKYVARVVITNILCNKSYSPASILLALYTAMSLSENNNWVQYFRPIHTQGIDLKDIGALGIEANFEGNKNGFGSRIDTKAESFSLADLGTLVSSLIQPSLIYSIDIPESGPQTWYESIFAAAADNVQGAIDQLVSAANDLTNNHFGRFWTGKSIINSTADSRIHLGYYVDRENKLRDIRDIDYIAVANYAGESNIRMIQTWSDTFNMANIREDVRLFHRKRVIMSCTGERAEITGFARRVTFDANFLDALAKGIQACGMAVGINTPLSGDLFNNERAAASFMSSAMFATQNNIFNVRSAAGGNFGGFNPGYIRSW